MLNDILREQLINWVEHLLKSLDKMGEKGPQQQDPEVDVEFGRSCAWRMRKDSVNLLKVPWGSANPSDAVDGTSDAMANLETRIQSVLRDCSLNFEVVKGKTYNVFFSEPKDQPTNFEQRPSICLFPFYKVEDNRPCWSMFKFGFQQRLGLILNDGTAVRLLNDRRPPGYYEDISLKSLLVQLNAGLQFSKANKENYQRDWLLDFGKGYAATDILEVMLKKNIFDWVDFRKEELLVGLAEALADPIKPSDEPVMPFERKEDVAKLLCARSGTRFALISDPGEPTFIYLKNNLDNYKDLVIYNCKHTVNVDVGIGFSLGMIRWFVAIPNVMSGLADQIFKFLIGEPKSNEWRDAIESRGVDIVESDVKDNYYHVPSDSVVPKPTPRKREPVPPRVVSPFSEENGNMPLNIGPQVRKEIEDILAILAADDPTGPQRFFRFVVNKANLPQVWTRKLSGAWSGDANQDAQTL